MSNGIRTEIRKFFSTRMWWVLLIMLAAYMIFLAATMAFSLGYGAEDMSGEAVEVDPLAQAKSVYTIAVSFGYVFPALIGIMSVTGEFRHGTIVPSLLFEPSRTKFLVSKLIAALPAGVLYGLVGVLSGTLAGAGTLAIMGEDPMLGEASVWRSIVLAVIALTVWTVVGVGIGSVISNQVAAIVVILAFTQFVEPIVRMALPAALNDAGAAISAYLPGAAGEALSEASFYATMGMADVLAWWQGALVLIAYGLVLAFIGRVTTLRKDIA